MADVRPFRAVRYARPTEAVTAPPYDVITDDERAALLARDPHNVAYLTLEPDAAIAGARLREWLADGVMTRDESPAVWWLEQDFVGPDGVARSRRGIVASLRAEPYAAGAVLPHERTHRGPIEGRLSKVEAAVREAEDVARQRSNPAAKARAQETVDSLLAAIAKYEKQAEKARAANNAKQIADAEASIAARREWLAEAEKMLAEFN